jgi:hypothetical protein
VGIRAVAPFESEDSRNGNVSRVSIRGEFCYYKFVKEEC